MLNCAYLQKTTSCKNDFGILFLPFKARLTNCFCPEPRHKSGNGPPVPFLMVGFEGFISVGDAAIRRKKMANLAQETRIVVAVSPNHLSTPFSPLQSAVPSLPGSTK
jgi:hypothetical protein